MSVRGILAGGPRRAVGLALLPGIVAGLALKIGRSAGHLPSLSWWQKLALVLPEILYFAGLIALLAALLALTGRGLRFAGILAAQLLALVTFAADLFGFGYFRATGTTLDLATVAYSLRHPAEIAPIVASELTWGTGLLMAAVPLWIAIAPWVGRSRPAPAPVPDPPRAPWRPALAAGLSIPCFLGAYGMTLPDVPASHLRPSGLQLLAGLFAPGRPEASSAPSAPPPPPPRRTGPKRLERTAATRPLNVAVIVLESTAAGATTAYRPELPVTPFLAEFARTATQVERAYAVVPHTSKALVAILCGIEPRPSLEIVEAAEHGLPAPCLPNLLAELGYDTAFFQAPRGSFERRGGLARNLGFARFLSGDEMPAEGFEKINYFGYEDAILIGPSERWLRAEAREPFFVTYLTSAPHHPYGVPSTYESRRFSDGESNAYLNTLHYVDGVVARIVESYKTLGLYERTVFVVVGDHGEAFGEHQLYFHDDVLYDEVLRVPLIVRLPAGSSAPARLEGPVNQLSIPPTIVSALGLRPAGGEWEGESIFSEPADRPLYAACFRNPRCLATVRGERKLIYHFEDQPPLLFDLKADPEERVNLAPAHPDLVADWARDLTDWAIAVDEIHKDQTAAVLARFVRDKPPERLRNPLNGRFGELVEVLGCNARRLNRGRVEVSCDLRVLSRVSDLYRIRVRGQVDGEPAQTFDHKPVGGVYPMRHWKPGDYINDAFEILAPDPWEGKTVALCLTLQADGEAPVALIPPPLGGGACLPFALLPPRSRP